MENPKEIYITGYVSYKDLDAFANGETDTLYLWNSDNKGKKEVLELKVPLQWVYRDETPYYIRREDFVDQF